MSSGGFSSSALVCPTTQNDVLLAIVAKLRHDIPEFDADSACFISDVPWPGIEVQNNLFATICPHDSSFDGQFPVGAGSFGIVEFAMFNVSVWSRIETDQLEHTDGALTDSIRGLLPLKQKVLKSLAGQQLYSDAPTNTRPLLVEWLRPTTAQHPPSRQFDDDFSSFSIVFEADMQWDLS